MYTECIFLKQQILKIVTIFSFFFLHSWFSTLSYQQPVEDLTGVTVFTKTRTINDNGSHLAPNTS